MLQAGAFATIANESGEVLLCHRRDLDLWNSPGGRVEPGESPWEAVVREVREETGVDADVVRLASVSWKPHRNEFLFQFVCRIVAGDLCTTEESDAFQYFPLDELPEQLSPASGADSWRGRVTLTRRCSSPTTGRLAANFSSSVRVADAYR